MKEFIIAADPLEDDALGSLLGHKEQEKTAAQRRDQQQRLELAFSNAAKMAVAAAQQTLVLLDELPEFDLLAGSTTPSGTSTGSAETSASAGSVAATADDEEGYGYSDDEFEKIKSVRFCDHVQVAFMAPHIYEERKQLFFQSEDYARFCKEGEEEQAKQQQAENLRVLQEKMKNTKPITGEESEYDF